MTALLEPSDRKYLEKLRDVSRRTLGAALSGATDVVLAGVPNHWNLGDTMITAGTLTYLKQLGARPVRVLDPNFTKMHQWRQIAELPKAYPILLNGGGNVGDLYPHEEGFRADIFERFPDRRFIIMPQTIHFDSGQSAQRSSQVYSQVGKLTVMVRDSASESLAQGLYPAADVLWSPDHALGWSPKIHPRRGAGPTVIARSDAEARGMDQLPISDWEFSRVNTLLWEATAHLGLRLRHFPGSRHLRNASSLVFHAQSQINLTAAQRVASSASVIVANRLHAHLLAVLSGRPHFITDNTHGKIRRIFDEYTGEFSTAHWSPSLTMAVQEAEEWVQRR